MIVSVKFEILFKFARKAEFHTFLYIIQFLLLVSKNLSESIKNGKSTPKMYFQVVYIHGNFWKFWFLGSPVVEANLAFGLIIYVGMIFSIKYLFSDEKIKSAPHTFIKSCQIPNFFWKNRVFYVSKVSQSQGMRGRFLLHKNLWNWISPSWKYFLHPLAPKNNVLQGVCYVHGVLKNRCPFMMDFEICLILW